MILAGSHYLRRALAATGIHVVVVRFVDWFVCLYFMSCFCLHLYLDAIVRCVYCMDSIHTTTSIIVLIVAYFVDG